MFPIQKETGSASIEADSLSMMALDEALSAPEPHPRSPAFAVQALCRLSRAAGTFTTRKDFLRALPSTSADIYQGKLSWNYEQSCWQLADGPLVHCSRIEEDAVRWYINRRDFSRHTRDPKFSYPENAEDVFWSEDGDRLYDALMPLSDELTRRIIRAADSDELGYCDVYRSNEPDRFTAVLGFFEDPRTHAVVRSAHVTFWELEGAIIPRMLKRYQVLRYDVLPLSAKRGV